MPIEKLKLLAPAKLNLCLHVLGRRADGYHELNSLMQRVDLYDEIELSLARFGDVKVECPGVVLPPGVENIAARAARAFCDEVERPAGVKICIRKKIPAAAGLGGGSSDAATVLLGLNRLCGSPLSVEQLARLGVGLGADVPFFIFERSAWAAGIGEILEPVSFLPKVFYLLLNPGVAVSTASIFRKLGLTTLGGTARMRGFPRDSEELVRLLHNDLQGVTEAQFPQVRQARLELINVGAEGALMSGSGATVFGVFTSYDEAQRAAEEIGSRHPWWKTVVKPLDL